MISPTAIAYRKIDPEKIFEACPFCGTWALCLKIITFDPPKSLTGVVCKKCGTAGPKNSLEEIDGVDEALRAWNHRPPSAADTTPWLKR